MRILAGAVTALRRLVDVVLIALIIVVLFGLVLGKLLPLMGRQTIVVGGSSMEPAVHLGSAIIIRSVDPAALAVGDVVSLKVGPEQTVFTHRIITITDRSDGSWIRTQGDANAGPDPTFVPTSDVIGRVEFAIPYAGYLLALLSQPLGVMFILGLAATLLAMAWLLETLELERPGIAVSESPGRRAGVADQDGVPALTAATGVRLDDFLRGEPIAARPTAAERSRREGGGHGGAGGTGRTIGPRLIPGSAGARSAFTAHSTALASASGPVSRTWPDAGGRSPVRTQLDRSREVRARRASWLRGGRGPID